MQLKCRCVHAETLVLFVRNTIMLQWTCAALESSPWFFKSILVILQGPICLSHKVCPASNTSITLSQIPCMVHCWSLGLVQHRSWSMLCRLQPSPNLAQMWSACEVKRSMLHHCCCCGWCCYCGLHEQSQCFTMVNTNTLWVAPILQANTGDGEYHMLIWEVPKPVQFQYIALKQCPYGSKTRWQDTQLPNQWKSEKADNICKASDNWPHQDWSQSQDRADNAHQLHTKFHEKWSHVHGWGCSDLQSLVSCTTHMCINAFSLWVRYVCRYRMQSSNLTVHNADANQTSSKVRLAGNTAARLLAGAMRTILCFDRSVIVARPRLGGGCGDKAIPIE